MSLTPRINCKPAMSETWKTPGSAFKTGKDFEGKRVAVNTRNNIIWLYARAWIQATGQVNRKRINVITPA